MNDPLEIKTKYEELIKHFGDLIKKLGFDIDRLDSTSYTLPTWEELKDQKILYTAMFDVEHLLEPVNRRLSGIHILRVALKKLRHNSRRIEFREKQIAENRIKDFLDIIDELESALKIHKEILDRKSRILNSAQFMQTNERYSPASANLGE